MALLKISEYPDKVLRTKCTVIERVTDSEAMLFEEMLFTMRHFAGIGLAGKRIRQDGGGVFKHSWCRCYYRQAG